MSLLHEKYILEKRLFTLQLRGEIGFGVHTRKVLLSEVPPENLNIYSSARRPLELLILKAL